MEQIKNNVDHKVVETNFLMFAKLDFHRASKLFPPSLRNNNNKSLMVLNESHIFESRMEAILLRKLCLKTKTLVFNFLMARYLNLDNNNIIVWSKLK